MKGNGKRKMEKEYEVRYFFDYSSRTCLWSNNEKTKLKYGNRINIQELNISEQLKNSMNELIKEYDNSIDWNTGNAKNDFDIKDFKDRAWNIYLKLCEELVEFSIINELKR